MYFVSNYRSIRILFFEFALVMIFSAIIVLGATISYEYDDANRLVGVSYSDGTEIRYTYDPAGNLLRREVTTAAAEPTATATNTPTPVPTPVATALPGQLVLSQGYGGSTVNKMIRATDLGRVTNFAGLPKKFAELLKTSRERSTNTAVADINGDGVKNVVVGFGPGGMGAVSPSILVVWSPSGGPGGGPKVITSRGAFSTSSPNELLRNPHGGVSLTAGNFVGDELPMIVAAQSLGGSNQIRVLQYAEVDGKRKLEHVGVFQGLTGAAVRGNSSGGTSVAAGDVDGDGLDELIVGQMNGEGASTLFQVLDLEKAGGVRVAKRTDPVSGMPVGYRGLGGVNLAVGDVDGDGQNEIIVATAGIPDGANGNETLKNFVRVFRIAVDGSNTITAITPAAGMNKPVQVFGGAVNPSGGIDIAAGNLDEDVADELLVSTQAIMNLDEVTGEVTAVSVAPGAYARGLNLEFDNVGNFVGITPVTPRFTAFDGAYTPTSGAVNVEIYPMD